MGTRRGRREINSTRTTLAKPTVVSEVAPIYIETQSMVILQNAPDTFGVGCKIEACVTVSLSFDTF